MLIVVQIVEAYSEPSQTSWVNIFAKPNNSYKGEFVIHKFINVWNGAFFASLYGLKRRIQNFVKFLIINAKSSILDVRQGSEYASEVDSRDALFLNQFGYHR